MPTEENQGDEAEKVAEEEPGGGDQIAAEEDKVDETENAPEEDKGGEAEIPTEENQQDGEPAEENQEGDMPSEEQPGTNTQATKPSTGTGGGAGGGGGGRVSLATEDDIPDLIPIFLDSFSGAAKKKTFPETESGRKWLERSFANFLGSKSQYHPEGKVPVVRNANGKPVAFAISHVVQAGQNVVGNSWKQRWGDANGLPDVSEEQLAKFFEPFAKVHHLAVGPQAHVFIEFLMTKLQSRKNGYASEIMDWATKLADDLNCACYLDGGGRGMGICERAGFEAQDVEDRYGDIPPSVPMLRARATA
ncbi:hypothetical protein GGS20DRAFT_544888 [Poronia punctata]|nr:hypothetical protein GGS20DRAFT_544888 [Poronia punctata]